MDIMPPENQLPPHHAPMSLKVWLLIFAILLATVMGYLVWVQNTTPDTTDNSAVVTKKTMTTTPTTTKTTDVQTYKNTKYNFQLILPPAWAGYTVAEGSDPDNKATTVLTVTVPTTDKTWTDVKYTPISVLIYSYAQWKTNATDFGLSSPATTQVLGHDSAYYFAGSTSNGVPPTDHSSDNYDKILATFKLL